MSTIFVGNVMSNNFQMQEVKLIYLKMLKALCQKFSVLNKMQLYENI